MRHPHSNRIAIGLAALVLGVPAAEAAVGHTEGTLQSSSSSVTTETLPPIDAGSSIPNPVYVSTETLPPIDAGSSIPNPVYVSGLRPDDRASRPQVYGPHHIPYRPAPIVTASPAAGFDWADAGIGAAAGAGLAALMAGSLLVLRRGRHDGLAQA